MKNAVYVWEKQVQHKCDEDVRINMETMSHVANVKVKTPLGVFHGCEGPLK